MFQKVLFYFILFFIINIYLLLILVPFLLYIDSLSNMDNFLLLSVSTIYILPIPFILNLILAVVDHCKHYVLVL